MASDIVIYLLAGVGAMSLLGMSWRLLRFVQFHFWLPRKPLQRYRRDTGDTWALITGSSAGIGFGYASELVRRGFEVIIHSHRQDELDEVEAQLKAIRPGAQVKKLCLDVGTFTNADVDEIARSVADLPITILVNNVGGNPTQGGGQIRDFATLTAEEVDIFINMNARFMAQLTRALLPQLSRQRRALIIGMSSGSRVGMPWLGMYTGCKAFVWSFTSALAREMVACGQPVDCVAVSPGEVASQGNTNSMVAGTPASLDYARMTLDRVDSAVDMRLRDVSPYWVHTVQTAIMLLLPESLLQTAIQDGVMRKREMFAKSK